MEMAYPTIGIAVPAMSIAVDAYHEPVAARQKRKGLPCVWIDLTNSTDKKNRTSLKRCGFFFSISGFNS